MNPEISSPTRRKPEQDRSKKRVDAILHAAKTLIASRGIEPLSMTDVATEAGMGLTALYRYFPNKTAVVRQLAVDMLEQDRSGLLNEILGLDASVDKLLTLATHQYVELHQKEPYRMALRSAIQSDAELLELDMNDTMANAQILGQKLAEVAGVQNPEPVQSFVLLYVNLLNATITLMANIRDRSASEAMLDTLVSMSLVQLHQLLDQNGHSEQSPLV